MRDFYFGCLRVSSAVLLALTMPASLAAHHSIAPFDQVHGTIIAGTVAAFAWKNPHAVISLDVAGDNGAVEHWSIQLETPNLLRRYGWAADTLRHGDRVAVTGGRAKNGQFIMRALMVELSDGRRLPAAPDN